jgi:hypothetical protein
MAVSQFSTPQVAPPTSNASIPISPASDFASVRDHRQRIIELQQAQIEAMERQIKHLQLQQQFQQQQHALEQKQQQILAQVKERQQQELRALQASAATMGQPVMCFPAQTQPGLYPSYPHPMIQQTSAPTTHDEPSHTHTIDPTNVAASIASRSDHSSGGPQFARGDVRGHIQITPYTRHNIAAQFTPKPKRGSMPDMQSLSITQAGLSQFGKVRPGSQDRANSVPPADHGDVPPVPSCFPDFEGLVVCAVCADHDFARSSPNFVLHFQSIPHLALSDTSTCDVCGWLLVKESVHPSRALKKPLYSCFHCTTRFQRGDQLLGHALQHNGKKPYRCPMCPSAYTRRQRFLAHLAEVHPEQRNLYDSAGRIKAGTY